MIKTVIGDVVEASEDIICHQVNCQNVMGAGVAKALYTRFPQVKQSYHCYCKKFKNPEDLLGQVQFVDVLPGKQIANIFGQLEYGRDSHKRYTDYTALANAFNRIKISARGKSLAFPYGFGCGLANGDWGIVRNMIEEFFSDADVVIYQLSILEK